MPVYTFAYTEIPIPPSDPFPLGQTAWRPLTFAAALGLDPLKMKMQMTGGVGSVANATYYETITVRIPITEPNGNTTTIEFQALTGFTAGMDAQGIGLLGQLGFFETFPVTFNHKGKAFSIEA